VHVTAFALMYFHVVHCMHGYRINAYRRSILDGTFDVSALPPPSHNLHSQSTCHQAAASAPRKRTDYRNLASALHAVANHGSGCMFLFRNL
jgi:hypothetical protein